MAGKLNSISARDISSAVKAAVKNSAALKEMKVVDAGIASIHRPITGFFPRDIDLKNASLSELNKLASSVAESLSPGKGKPTTLIHGGNILIGYVEDASFSAFKE